MTHRPPFIVGNWKLNKTLSEAVELATAIRSQLTTTTGVDVGVAPVYTALSSVANAMENAGIALVGQNCHWETNGAWTGEVSAPLLADVGCKYVIIGHSERRQHFHDTDESIAKRLAAARQSNLGVILCVGETREEHEAGQTLAVVTKQLDGGLALITQSDLAHITIAYEPVWAIGTGLTATPAQAQGVHETIRAWLKERFGPNAGEIRIQYGGSVKPANAAELLSQPDIDGALVGGASLNAQDFVAIIQAAATKSG